MDYPAAKRVSEQWRETNKDGRFLILSKISDADGRLAYRRVGKGT